MGDVKTRLAKDIGAPAALNVYQQLVARQWNQIPSDWNVEIHFTPQDAEAEMRDKFSEHDAFFPQCDGDLGNRLSYATETAFLRGASPVFCIGADCPNLNTQDFHKAYQTLNQGVEAVFGPTEDGGYYLLGMARPHLTLFQNIPWSTTNTLQASLQRAEESHLTTHLLPMKFDVDHYDDLVKAISTGCLPPNLDPEQA